MDNNSGHYNNALNTTHQMGNTMARGRSLAAGSMANRLDKQHPRPRDLEWSAFDCVIIRTETLKQSVWLLNYGRKREFVWSFDLIRIFGGSVEGTFWKIFNF